MFDGHEIIPQPDVWVQDGKVQAVGKGLKCPASITVIDGTGNTLLPGLIDAHTHANIRTGLKQELIFGVTSELGMQNDPTFVAQVKREHASGKALDLADMRSAGWPATAPGGHRTEGGISVPTITGPEQAQPFVNSRVKDGSDYLKVIYEDGSMFGLHSSVTLQSTYDGTFLVCAVKSIPNLPIKRRMVTHKRDSSKLRFEKWFASFTSAVFSRRTRPYGCNSWIRQ